MPDEPIDTPDEVMFARAAAEIQAEAAGETPIPEGHLEAGAAIDFAAQGIRVGPHRVQVQYNPQTGVFATVPETAVPEPEPPPRKEITKDDIEREITFHDHREFCQGQCNLDRLVLLHSTMYGYCKLDTTGRKRWVKTLGAAQVFEVGSAFIQSQWTWGEMDIKLLLIKEPPVVPGCLLTDWFDKRFITLIEDAPNNLVTRAHMMRVLKVEPARELDTYDKLKEWVEKTFPNPRKGKLAAPTAVSSDWAVLDPVVMEPQRQRDLPGFVVTFRVKEHEYGSCRYAVSKSTRQDIEIDADHIRAFVEHQGVNSLNGVKLAMSRMVWDHELEWEYGDYETEDYNSEGTRDGSSEAAGGFPTEALVQFITANAPDLIDRLNLPR